MNNMPLVFATFKPICRSLERVDKPNIMPGRNNYFLPASLAMWE